MSSDSRIFRRRASAIDFKVYDRKTGALIGRVGDLSEGGLLVYGPLKLEAERLYTLSIRYPAKGEEDGEAVFEAKAMWVKVDVNPVFYATGFRLFDLQRPEIRAQLDFLMNRFTVSIDEVTDDDYP
jgi:hypothetical protein